MLTWTPDRRASQPLRVLCLGAHPDDLEIGCGGTLLALAAARDLRVHWIVFSGTAERRTEARRSAGRLLRGARAAEVVVEDFRDGYFPDQWAAIKDRFEQLKRRVQPDLIFTHHTRDRHQDHRVLAELTWNTFRAHAILEYEIPKYDGGLETPNVYVPLDARTRRRKVRHVLGAFPSQAGKHWFDEATLLGLMRLRGVECGARAGYAEAFHGTKLVVTI